MSESFRQYSFAQHLVVLWTLIFAFLGTFVFFFGTENICPPIGQGHFFSLTVVSLFYYISFYPLSRFCFVDSFTEIFPFMHRIFSEIWLPLNPLNAGYFWTEGVKLYRSTFFPLNNLCCVEIGALLHISWQEMPERGWRQNQTFLELLVTDLTIKIYSWIFSCERVWSQGSGVLKSEFSLFQIDIVPILNEFHIAVRKTGTHATESLLCQITMSDHLGYWGQDLKLFSCVIYSEFILHGIFNLQVVVIVIFFFNSI